MKVFLSYSSQDEVKSELLYDALRQAKLDVWFDQEQLIPGDELKPKIAKAISEARIFLACFSPNYVRNFPGSWTEIELKTAIVSEGEERVKKIIPVKLNRLKEGQKLPGILGARAFADMSSPKKWEKNIVKLISAIKDIYLSQNQTKNESKT